MSDKVNNTIDVDDININVGKGGESDWLNDSIGSMKKPKTKKINGYMESAQTPNGIFQLPSINEKNKSPFKGFLDISIVT